MSVEKATGETPPELVPPPSPTLLGHVWLWFIELQSARTSNGFGPNPISYTEIASWASLTRRQVTGYDVQLLRKLDAVYLSNVARRQDGNKHRRNRTKGDG